MALISQSIKNLKGGVSQQPDILRFPDQGAAQINGWSSDNEGTQKRPPSVFHKVIAGQGDLGVKPLVHLINRDAVEQYYAVFTGSDVRVFGLDGTEYTVRGDKSYVQVANPRVDLRMITVADYTFVVNRNVVVANNDDQSNGGTFNDKQDALINVRGGQYGRVLEVTINGTLVAKFEIPDGSNPVDSKSTDAQLIAKTLADQMMGVGTLPAGVTKLPDGWTATVGNGYIHVVAPAGSQIDSLKAQDGFANQLIAAVTHYTQSFTKLPVEAPNGYKVKIMGDTSKTADQYYVEYDSTRKVWRETIGWNVTQTLTESTLPWTLVRAADGQFDFGTHSWSPRESGDDVTNPHPSLVGQTINDIFFFRNRLGFLAGENIVMSRTAKYFNLYPASVANLSDDDPIDVAVSHNRISILKYAVPFSEELLLWSDQAQFVLGANGILSAKSVELNLTTEFDVYDNARPFGVGRNIHFASPRAAFTSINRYYAVQDVSAVKSAEDITAHVPSYIPNGVFSIHGSSTENYVSVLTEGDPSKVFLYKFLYLDEQLRQQSWSYWDFGDNVEILAASSIGSTMYVMARNGFSTYIVSLSFKKATVDFLQEPYRIYLDHKKMYTVPAGTYNDSLYATTFDIRDIYGMNFLKGSFSVVEADGKVETFVAPENGWANSPYITMSGNKEGAVLVCGFNFEFRYVFSKFLIKKTADDGTTSTEDSGRLQLRRAWVNYQQTGAFTVDVENTSRVFTYTMAGARINSAALKAGALNLGTGQFRFPVTGNANYNTVTIHSDTPTPLAIIGAGWEGNYTRRTSGI